MSTLTEMRQSETKADRRARILSTAQALMSKNGFGGLSLRKLASASNVTVPTIYNLIGGKDEILLELSAKMIEVIEDALTRINEEHPLEKAEEIVFVATGCVESDPGFHRAALLAMDHMQRHGLAQGEMNKLGRRAATMQEKAAASAQKLGLMEGKIPAKIIGEQIFRNYQSASREWACRRIGVKEFRRIALLGVYLNLAADAAPLFKKVLLKKIKILTE